MSILNESQSKKMFINPQMNLGNIDIVKQRVNQKPDTLCYDSFIYRDHVTFKDMEARCLKKYHQNLQKNHQACHHSIKLNIKSHRKIGTTRNIPHRNPKKNINNQDSCCNKDLIKLKSYLDELKNIRKYRNQELLKNTKKVKNKLNAKLIRFASIDLTDNENKGQPQFLSKKLQHKEDLKLLNLLKKEVQDLNRKQLRKYLNNEINYKQANTDLIQIEEGLGNYNLHMAGKMVKDFKNTNIVRSKSKEARKYFRTKLPSNNSLKMQQKELQFQQFQYDLPAMIRARISHETRYNWQKQNSDSNLRIKSFRRSLN